MRELPGPFLIFDPLYYEAELTEKAAESMVFTYQSSLQAGFGLNNASLFDYILKQRYWRSVSPVQHESIVQRYCKIFNEQPDEYKQPADVSLHWPQM